MTLRAPPGLATLATIPALAHESGVSYWTMLRRLMVLHGRDRQRGESHCLWLFRAPGGTWRVNRRRLYAEHPELFGAPAPEDLQDQVHELRESFRMLLQKVNSLHAVIREHRAEHRAR